MSPILSGLAVMCWKCASALVEQGEPAFADAAQGALEGVAGAGPDMEVAVVYGLLYGHVDAYSGTVVAGIGQGGLPGGGGAVEHG